MILNEKTKELLQQTLMEEYGMNKLQAISLIFDVHDCMITLERELNLSDYLDAVARFANGGLYFKSECVEQGENSG